MSFFGISFKIRTLEDLQLVSQHGFLDVPASLLSSTRINFLLHHVTHFQISKTVTASGVDSLPPDEVRERRGWEGWVGESGGEDINALNFWYSLLPIKT